MKTACIECLPLGYGTVGCWDINESSQVLHAGRRSHVVPPLDIVTLRLPLKWTLQRLTLGFTLSKELDKDKMNSAATRNGA